LSGGDSVARGWIRALGWWLRRQPGTLATRLRPTTDPVEREFRRHAPWVTRYRIGDRDYGGDAELVDDGRIAGFFDVFPDCRTVLELGCLEGAHSFSLARRVARVTAIEGRAANLEKAQLVQRLLGVENVTFLEADVERADLDLGRFDALFCVGLLYHLQRPWLLLDRFPAWSDRVFLQTHFADAAKEERDGLPGRSYAEFGSRDPLSGLSQTSFWLTLPALTGRLEQNGYRVDELDRDLTHPHGPIVTLAAER
jgi:SAM-dependent methyltransferase